MNKQIKDCDTCKHEDKDAMYEEPCMTCIQEDSIKGVPSRYEEEVYQDE